MYRKLLAFALLSGGLFAGGCSTEASDQQAGVPGLIEFEGSVADDLGMMATTSSSKFPSANPAFRIVAYEGAAPSDWNRPYIAPTDIKSSAGTLSWADGLTRYWPTAAGAVCFYAWSPVDATFNSGSLTFSVDGQQDIISAAVSTSVRDSAVALDFHHRLMKLTVKVCCSEIPQTFRDLKSVEVLNQSKQLALDPATGDVSVAGTSADSYTVYETPTGLALSTTPVEIGSVMILPFEEVDLRLVLVGEEMTVRLNLGQNAEAGVNYNVLLTLHGNYCDVAASVADWINIYLNREV